VAPTWLHYWLLRCSVGPVDAASAGVSPRAALERTSSHLACSSASGAPRSNVCWAWPRRMACLTSGLSPPDDAGTAPTSNPERGTALAPLESCRKETSQNESTAGDVRRVGVSSAGMMSHKHASLPSPSFFSG